MNPQAPANNNAVPDAPETAFPLSDQSPSVYTPAEVGVELFHAPGYRVELRGVRGKDPDKEIISIIHDHHELAELLKTACDMNAQGFACYHTIQPMQSDLRNTANDSNAKRMHWLPYDIDPVRESGTASTYVEKAEAWKVAHAIISFWTLRGITPAVVDSGNGYYVLVPIDLPVDEAGWVEGTLHTHSKQFSTPGAKVDTTTSNPSRILRVPGTWNVKGPNTPERPHRQCKILSPGSRLHLADPKSLEGVKESKALPVGTPSNSKVRKIAEALRANFQRLDYPDYTEPEVKQKDGAKFHNFRFSPCLMGGHKDGDDSCLIRIREDGVLAFKCYHDSHSGEEWQWAKVRPKLEAEYGVFDFRDAYTGGSVTVGQKHAEPTPQAPTPRKLKLTSFCDMQSRVIEWYWPGRLARGHITTFNGDPGTMKSFASIDVAARVTTGRAFPDGEKNPLAPSSALVLTREDGLEDTVKPRFLAAGGNPRFLHTLTMDGSAETAVVKIEEHLSELDAILPADTRLLIFDPLIDFLKAGQNDEQAVRDTLTQLKQFAEQRDLAVIGINHLNKKSDLEAIHRAMGAKGMIGVARMNYLFGKDEQGVRHMVTLKNNVWHEDGSLTFHVEDSTVEDNGLVITKIGRIAWDGKGAITADELSAPKKKPAIDLVGDWVKEVLKPAGTKKPADELYAAGQERGFSDDQVKRGLKRLNATYERTKTVPPKTLWYFPEVGW